MRGRPVSGSRALLAAAVLTTCQAASDPGAAPPVDEMQVFLRQVAATAPADVSRGKALFEEHCSSCHGPAADGTEQGPPLAHVIYEPSHHGDAAFLVAVRIGVRAHHWRFGNMEPLPQVSDPMVQEITAYVRWLQRAVGID